MTPEQAKHAYDTQGYALVRGVLEGEMLRQVQEAFDRAQKVKALGEILNQDDVFVDIVDHPKLLPVVRTIVGEDAQLRYARGGVIRPNSDSGSGWHCDLSEIGGVNLRDSVIMTKLFTYLEDVTTEGACLACVPGSHRYELGHPLPNLPDMEDMPHHAKMIVKAGDAVLMNGYTWHARFHNRSDMPRKVLEYSYIHSWMKTQFEFSDLSDHVQDLVMASHNRRQLFGVPEPGVRDWERRLKA